LILEPLDRYGMLAVRFGVLERIYITSIAHSSIHIHSLDTGKKCLDFVWFQREKKKGNVQEDERCSPWVS
jgi:hypothetical protein